MPSPGLGSSKKHTLWQGYKCKLFIREVIPESGFKVRPVIIDCMVSFSHRQPHRGRHSIDGNLDLTSVVVLPGQI